MLYSKSRGGRIVFQKYNFTIIKDKYRLWKCFRFKEAKEMWHLNVVPDPRLDPVLETGGPECGGALKVIIGSIGKIGICIVEDHVNVKNTNVSNCNYYITMVM